MRLLVLGTVAVLFLYSLHLAINRIIQVDEAQNLYMAKIIGSGQTARYFAKPELFLLGPLAWIAESATSAREAFVSGRLIFAGVFWLNIFLLAKCAGASLRTTEGLLVILSAATLAPLWDYGFEIRHDNLLLTGLLLIWLLGRYRADATSSFFAIGVVSGILQFVTFKALACTLPVSAYFLASRAIAAPAALKRDSMAWLAGIAAAGIACWSLYFFLGLLVDPVHSAAALRHVSQSESRFYPFGTLSRLLSQTPLLVAVATAALLLSVTTIVRMPTAMFRQDGPMPEAFLAIVAVGVLFINPTPFPYNLITVVPFAFLLACRFIRQVLPAASTNRPIVLLAVSIFAFSHLVPFFEATWRHLHWNNWRQMRLMETAEAMTNPATDPVYDAAGLVVTRHSIDRWWYLHSLNMRQMYDGNRSPVADLLARNPAAVLMPNYRFDWLRESDWQFIRANYLPLADDFWVLGTTSPPGGGEFRTLRSGRYQVLAAAGTRDGPPLELVLDGEQVRSDILTLAAGNHTIKATDAVAVTIVWLGPTLDRLPSIGAGDHRTIFFNWY